MAVVLVAAASIACDALCFGFALRAVGIHPRPGEFLLVYGAAMVASFVPLLPNGLGTVETVVPLLLHHGGTPLAAGLAAVLVYRATATVLPAAAGTLSLVLLRLSTVGVARPQPGPPARGPVPKKMTGSKPRVEAEVGVLLP